MSEYGPRGRITPDLCGSCNKYPTKEGHDACLGTLKGDQYIMNACCGHGDKSTAYVQYSSGILRGADAVKEISRLRGESNE